MLTKRLLSTVFRLCQAGIAAAVEGNAVTLLPTHLGQIRRADRNGRQVNDRAAGAADEMPVWGDIAVVAILAIHAADDLHRAFAAEASQIAVHRGQRQIGDLRLQLGVDPFGRRVALGGAQALQDGFPLGTVSCFYLRSSFL